MTNTKFLLVALCLGSACQAFAGVAQATNLNWPECVALATKNNPALASAYANLRSAQEQTLSNRYNFFPQISGNFGYNYTNTNTVNTGNGVVITGPSTTIASGQYNASIVLNQNLFNGLEDLAKINEGKANEGMALASLLTTKALISANLKNTFENLVFAKKSVKLASDIAARRDQNLKLVTLRFKDGQENKGSVLLYEAYLKDAQFSQLQSKDLVSTAKSQLAQALGLDEFEPIDISGTVPLSEPIPQPDMKKLAVLAPTYIQADYQEQFNDAAVVVARSNLLPNLSAAASEGRTGADFFPQNNHWSLGVTLSVPIFNGGRDYYATRSAIETREASKLTLRDTAHQAQAVLEQAYMAYVESIERLKVDQSYLEASRVRAEIARADYNNGLMSFQDWDLAETDLINRQRNILSDEQNRVQNEASWEQAMGRGVIP